MENIQGKDVKRVGWHTSILELKSIIQHINNGVSKEHQVRIKGNKGELLQRVWDFYGIPHEQRAAQQIKTKANKESALDDPWNGMQAQNQQRIYEEWKKVDNGQKMAKIYNIHKKWDIWSDTECECDICKQKLQHPKLPRITTILQAITQVEDGITESFRKQFIGTRYWKTLKGQITKREVCICILILPNHIASQLINN